MFLPGHFQPASPRVACVGEVWGSALIPPSPPPSLTPAPKQAPSPGGSCLSSTHYPPSAPAPASPRSATRTAGLLSTILSDSSPHQPIISPLRPECCFSNTILCISLFPRDRSLTHDCHLENKDRALQLGVGSSLLWVLLRPPCPGPWHQDSTPPPPCSRGCASWHASLLS